MGKRKNWNVKCDVCGDDIDLGDPTERNVVHTYAKAGTYTVTHRATDDSSHVATITKQVTVAASSGSVVTVRATATTSMNNLNLTCTDSSTTSIGTITKWLWDFGDGTTSTAQNVVHKYARPGTYVVNLLVTDSSGHTGMFWKEITVTSWADGIKIDGGLLDTILSSEYFVPLLIGGVVVLAARSGKKR